MPKQENEVSLKKKLINFFKEYSNLLITGTSLSLFIAAIAIGSIFLSPGWAILLAVGSAVIGGGSIWGLKKGLERKFPKPQKTVEQPISSAVGRIGREGDEHGNAISRIEELIDAIDRGDERKVKELIKEGVDVNAKDAGYIPLILAIRQGREKIVELLIKAGANIDIEDAEGAALAHAREKGNEKIIQLLTKAGARQDVEPTHSVLHIRYPRKTENIKTI